MANILNIKERVSLVIPSDVRKEPFRVDPLDGQLFHLEQLQSYVGGNIEMLDISDTRLVVCNEDGIGLGLPRNVRAETWFSTPCPMWGDVVVCDSWLIA